MEGDMTNRVEDLERWREDIEKRFSAAFPGGDHVGHCRYHDLMIEQLSERKRLRLAITEKTISALLWSGVAVVGVALWSYVKSLLGRD
jgi:hypothetical protein